MNRLERGLFPRNGFLNFLIVAVLSGSISYLMIGSQISQANWGMIDDHEIFNFLGPSLHLPAGEIWNTLLSKTEVGSLQGRFRPGYYVFKLVETSLWGDNVHLWYLARTIGFAVFLSSVWWLLRRFVGLWLGGAVTVYIALLPLWADIWSRLGPSEVYGAICIGAMMFSAYFIFFSENSPTRHISAVALAFSTVALVGMKETFIPLAGGAIAMYVLAGIRRKLALPIVAVLILTIVVALGGIVFAVTKELAASGADAYARPVEVWPVIAIAIEGFRSAVGRTWLLYAIPILLFGGLQLLRRDTFRIWIRTSGIAIGAWGFLVAIYASQCALYRSGFPFNSRYDFPAMLLVPLSLCVLACYVFYLARCYLSERTMNYAALAAAVLLGAHLASAKSSPTFAAVRTNIATTNTFYTQLRRVLNAAQQSPSSPIILEAYGPGAYEPVFSLLTYLSALGAKNRISVRLHPEEKSQGVLYDGLQQTLAALESGSSSLAPLRESLANRVQGCISIGILGAPDQGCDGFMVKVR